MSSSDFIQPLPDFRPPIIDVEEDGTFRVSGLGVREQRSVPCGFCDYHVSGPATYQIENLQTKEKMAVPELTMHLIKSHEYFGKKPGLYRVDPDLVCKVLNLKS